MECRPIYINDVEVSYSRKRSEEELGRGWRAWTMFSKYDVGLDANMNVLGLRVRLTTMSSHGDWT